MNKKERIELVKAMELLARAVNDESVFDMWLTYGVADGTISDNTDDDNLEWYIDDERFAELMETFLDLMRCAHRNGGLYCDNVVSKLKPIPTTVNGKKIGGSGSGKTRSFLKPNLMNHNESEGK